MSGAEGTIRWWGRRWLVWPVVVVVALACVGPAVPWAGWGFGSEAVNVATAMEMRRTGEWLVPTIQGELRLNKPPLTAWITAAAISDDTLGRIGDQPRARAVAEGELRWQARWPNAVLLCLSLVAVYELGRAMGGSGVGLMSAVCAGTTLLFFRHARWAQTDSQLAVWVAVTNAFLARALFRGEWWKGCVGGGIALGVAVLAKGQMGVLMTVVPFAIFAAVRRSRVNWRAVAVGLLLALVIGGWWFVYVGVRAEDGWRVFLREATRVGANELKSDSVRNYARYFVLMLPWTPVLILGAVEAVRKRDNGLLAVLLVAVPLVVMLPFKERKERYLAPLVSGGAVVAAWGLAAAGRDPRARRAGPWVVGAVAALGVGYSQYDFWTKAVREGASVMRPFAEAVWEAAPGAEVYGYAPVDTQAAYLLVPGAEMAIHLNRPVRWVKDVGAIERGAGDQALLFVLPTEDVLAEARTAGWVVARDETRRDVRRVMMVRKRERSAD